MKKDEAIRLRKLGYSYTMIRQKTGVSVSTMSYWFKDIPYRPNKETLERTRIAQLASAISKNKQRLYNTKLARRQAIEEIGEITSRDILMLGIGLYIGEGSKSIESVRITNSDPSVIKLAMKWLRVSCDLSDDNFSLILFLYPDTDEDVAKFYWSKVTDLPLTSFKKSQIDNRGGKNTKNRGKLQHGTLQIRIKANGDRKRGVYLFRKIEGWIDCVTR